MPLDRRHQRCGPFAALLLTTFVLVGLAPNAEANERDGVLPPVSERFDDAEVEEVPGFQRHVVPLFGRLGCNGRACHGSFQGRGGFQLSLFGYDFDADHAALLDEESPRVDPQDPLESLILIKPVDEEMHEGGQRYEHGSWQYHVLRRWIEGGAEFDGGEPEELTRLEVGPAEIEFGPTDETVSLQVIAHWADGTREDVTPLCRFQSNDDQVAVVDEDGNVTSRGPGDTHVVVFYDNGVVPVPVMRPVSDLVGERYPAVPTPTEIDRLVIEKLEKLGIVPSELSSDAEFLRRVSLDLTGTLPTVDEVRAFLADTDPDKRERKIEELLSRPAYAAWWTTRLCDITGNNDAQLVNTLPLPNNEPSRHWYDWLYKRVEDNVPYDEIVEGLVLAQSRRPGQDYREYCAEMSELAREGSEAFAERETLPLYWARRNFRTREERAIGFAYTFLGIRIQCAQCHKHPFDEWSKQDFEDFSGLFATVVSANQSRPQDRQEYSAMVEELGLDGKRGGELRNEIRRLLEEGEVVPFPEIYVQRPRAANGNRNRNRNAPPATARLLGGEPLDLAGFDDPRQPLMDWLRDSDNRFFARAFVNRVWANYFGVGIVEPTDDMSLANPASNEPLLDYLAKGFVENNYDMKWLHREIVMSRTYQLSWRPNATNEFDQRNFSRAQIRRLPAEVAYDALHLATASSEVAETWLTSTDGRATAIPGANGQNRNRNGPAYALTVFGRSTRESNCDCDRSMDASLLQTVYLQNDQEIHALLERRDGWIQELAPSPRRAGGGNRTAAQQRQIQALEQRIERLRNSGRDDEARAVQRRLSQLRRAQPTPAPAPQELTADVDRVIEEAYLRTLSRYPSSEEADTARTFIDGAENPVEGVRGLMWALLNTKEFIVNH